MNETWIKTPPRLTPIREDQHQFQVLIRSSPIGSLGPFDVNKLTTVFSLKMSIAKLFTDSTNRVEVARNMRLVYGRTEIVDDSLTLAHFNVKNGDCFDAANFFI